MSLLPILGLVALLASAAERGATPTAGASSASQGTAPRDLATGQASGKRQHAPVTLWRQLKAKGAPAFPPDVKARGDQLWAAASPAVKQWASQQASPLAHGTADPEPLASAAVRGRWPGLHSATAPDTLAFVLLYQGAKDLQSEVQNKLDSRSELGETESLRLQKAMDRMSKLMETLSNILKKISDTDRAIVQNIK